MSQWSADALGRSAVRRALRPAVARCHALCPARMCVDRSRFAFHVWSFRRRLEVVGREILRRGGTFVAHGRLRTSANRRAAPTVRSRSSRQLLAATRCMAAARPRVTTPNKAPRALTESFQGGQGPRSRACQLAREGEPKKSGQGSEVMPRHFCRDASAHSSSLRCCLSCPCPACICLLPTSVLNNSQQAGASRLNSTPLHCLH
jgi:hypothetical protein